MSQHEAFCRGPGALDHNARRSLVPELAACLILAILALVLSLTPVRAPDTPAVPSGDGVAVVLQ